MEICNEEENVNICKIVRVFKVIFINLEYGKLFDGEIYWVVWDFVCLVLCGYFLVLIFIVLKYSVIWNLIIFLLVFSVKIIECDFRCGFVMCLFVGFLFLLEMVELLILFFEIKF